MEEFLAVEGRLPTEPIEIRSMVGWVRKALCKYRRITNVVNNRVLSSGGKVTQAMADDPKDVRAHGCPFVLESINARLFFIEKSSYGDTQEADIEALMIAQIDDFKMHNPAYDPVKTGKPSPSASLLKTYLTLFPNVIVDRPNGICPLLIRVRDKLKPEFMRNGMMLGEFFPGYPSGSLHAGNNFEALSAPVPSFAIRYMVAEDQVFAKVDPFKPLYEAYFPPTGAP